MKQSNFRVWTQNKWMDYKSEKFRMDGYVCRETPREYFQRYKWFLKELFKYENNK